MTGRTVGEWLAHPTALDRLLDGMAHVVSRYRAADRGKRLAMCGGNQTLRRDLDYDLARRAA